LCLTGPNNLQFNFAQFPPKPNNSPPKHAQDLSLPKQLFETTRKPLINHQIYTRKLPKDLQHTTCLRKIFSAFVVFQTLTRGKIPPDRHDLVRLESSYLVTLKVHLKSNKVGQQLAYADRLGASIRYLDLPAGAWQLRH